MASTRRLTAILAADVAGYSRLMGGDEEGPHERLKAHLAQLADPKIKEHRGRTVKNTGDGFLAVVDVVRCAVEGPAGDGRPRAEIARRPARQVSDQHQSRRRDCWGARPLRRRGQCRGAEQIIKLVLNEPTLSLRELAVRFTDTECYARI